METPEVGASEANGHVPALNGDSHAKTNGYVNETSHSPTACSTEQLLGVFEALQKLNQGLGIQSVLNTTQELRTLEITNRRNCRTIRDVETENAALVQRFEQKSEELAQATTKINELEALLKQSESEIDRYNEDIRKLNEKHAETEKELAESSAAKSKRLEDLESFAAKPLNRTRAELICFFDKVFTHAFETVNNSFGQDLDDNTFSSNAWKKFKDSFPHISLPPMNTPDAKRMRVAAVLAHLAQVATRELFQPVYSTESGDGFGNFIQGEDNYRQALRLRLVALNTNQGEQNENAQSRAAKVEKEVSDLVKEILGPARNQEIFAEALNKWCRRTARGWSKYIQAHEEAIVPALNPKDMETGVGDWELLNPAEGWMPANKKDHKLNGMHQVVARIWPVFTISGEDAVVEILKKGLVISETQAVQAKKEVSSANVADERRRHTPKRNSETRRWSNFLGNRSSAASINGGETAPTGAGGSS